MQCVRHHYSVTVNCPYTGVIYQSMHVGFPKQLEFTLHTINVGLTYNVWTVRIHLFIIWIGYMRVCGAVYDIQLQLRAIAEIAGYSVSVACMVYIIPSGKVKKEKRKRERWRERWRGVMHQKATIRPHALQACLAFTTNASLAPTTTTHHGHDSWDCRILILG